VRLSSLSKGPPGLGENEPNRNDDSAYELKAGIILSVLFPSLLFRPSACLRPFLHSTCEVLLSTNPKMDSRYRLRL
jgi:hypothetical protein